MNKQVNISCSLVWGLEADSCSQQVWTSSPECWMEAGKHHCSSERFHTGWKRVMLTAQESGTSIPVLCFTLRCLQMMKWMAECSGIWRAVHELVAQSACFPDTGMSWEQHWMSAHLLPPGTSLEAAQLLACKAQPVLRLTVSVRPWMSPWRASSVCLVPCS